MKIENVFWNNVAKYQKEFNIDDQFISEYLGIKVTTYRNRKHRYDNVSIIIANKIAEAIGLYVQDLFVE